jgi:hypothetical protein
MKRDRERAQAEKKTAKQEKRDAATDKRRDAQDAPAPEESEVLPNAAADDAPP